MRAFCFRSTRVYSANTYLVLGAWSRIEDVNVLVDPGADPEVLPFIEGAPTGVGKRKVDLVVLTHRHYDHATLVPAIRARYGAPVAGWGWRDDLVDRPLGDGERLRAGDDEFEVVHTPGHTDDSICLYAAGSQALFVGDAPVLVNSAGHTHEPGFLAAMRRLASLPVRTIYFGHGEPLTEGCGERLCASLATVEASVLGRHVRR